MFLFLWLKLSEKKKKKSFNSRYFLLKKDIIIIKLFKTVYDHGRNITSNRVYINIYIYLTFFACVHPILLGGRTLRREDLTLFCFFFPQSEDSCSPKRNLFMLTHNDACSFTSDLLRCGEWRTWSSPR